MATATIKKKKLTPPQVAAMWGVKHDKVLAWIRAGELRAIDASTKRGGRPRYLIDLDDLADFEAARAVSPPVKSCRRKRRQDHVIDFY